LGTDLDVVRVIAHIDRVVHENRTSRHCVPHVRLAPRVTRR
jgi:hypothetical protein